MRVHVHVCVCACAYACKWHGLYLQQEQGCGLRDWYVQVSATGDTGIQWQLLGAPNVSAPLLTGSALHLCIYTFSPQDLYPACPERGTGWCCCCCLCCVSALHAYLICVASPICMYTSGVNLCLSLTAGWTWGHGAVASLPLSGYEAWQSLTNTR